AALVRAEQARRWDAGDRVRLDVYLQKYPSLRADTQLLLDLIYSEVVLRERHGETVTPEEYVRRFGEVERQLRNQFTLHQVLRSNSLLDAAGFALAGLLPDDPSPVPVEEEAPASVGTIPGVTDPSMTIRGVHVTGSSDAKPPGERAGVPGYELV